MQQVLMGFTVVFIVIGIGWILGRRDTLGTHAQKPLSLFVYYVATQRCCLIGSPSQIPRRFSL